ncbi:MAG TPA: hypothetical protein VFJ16_30650 [Longimicrobium sp.]|nr:hypothetical protein [Longimicrobium sp.]
MTAPAAAPALSLVPPAPRPALSPADLLATRRIARVRRVATAVCVTGALLPVPCVAAAWYLGDAVYPGLLLGWAFLLPGGGFMLLLSAAAERNRDSLRALLLVALSFAAGIALIEPAARAGTEAFVSSHAAELDALAAGRAAMLAGIAPGDVQQAHERFSASPGAALRRLGLGAPDVVTGGLVFPTSPPFTPALLYADESLARWPNACANVRVTLIGGRWYLYECAGTRQFED